MSIATIIAPVTGAARDKAVLETAFAAARPFNAHVAALFTHADPNLALPYLGTPLAPDVIQSIIDATTEVNRAAAKAALKTVHDAAAAESVEYVSTPRKAATPTCSLREAEGFFPHCVARAARLSDLVVFGPLTVTDGPDLSDAFVETLMNTERPVLLAARPARTLNGHVMVAWDESPVAARALSAAMPFLEAAGKITLVACTRSDSAKTDFRDVLDYLAWHGCKAEGQTVAGVGYGVGEALLDAAKTGRADMLVMGGYGHSHFGEVLFGGVTQHVRWHAEVPVLMTH